MKNSIEWLVEQVNSDCLNSTFIRPELIKQAMEMYQEEVKPKGDMLEYILEWFSDEEILKADGFDEAIIGIDINSMRLIYSVSKCIEILSRDMSEEDAIDYFEYNVHCAYVGEKTPIWCTDNL